MSNRWCLRFVQVWLVLGAVASLAEALEGERHGTHHTLSVSGQGFVIPAGVVHWMSAADQHIYVLEKKGDLSAIIADAAGRSITYLHGQTESRYIKRVPHNEPYDQMLYHIMDALGHVGLACMDQFYFTHVRKAESSFAGVAQELERELQISKNRSGMRFAVDGFPYVLTITGKKQVAMRKYKSFVASGVDFRLVPKPIPAARGFGWK